MGHDFGMTPGPQPGVPATINPDLTAEQILAILYRAWQKWGDEWNRTPGHQKVLYDTKMGFDVLKVMVQELHEEAYAGSDRAEAFEEEFGAKKLELFPPPETSPSDFHAMMDAMKEEVFGETGLRGQFLDALKSTMEKIGEVGEQVADQNACMNLLQAELKKQIEAKAPASDDLGAEAAAVLKEADAKVIENEPIEVPQMGGEMPSDALRRKLKEEAAAEEAELRELEVLQRDGGPAPTSSKGSGRKTQ